MKRVYVGGWFRGLEEHRRLIKQAIMNLGMRPIMPEDFDANGDTKATVVDLIKQSDVFITIAGLPLGYYMELEFDRTVFTKEYSTARQRKMPLYVFLMSEKHPGYTPLPLWVVAQVHDIFMRDQVVYYFDSPDDLKAKVTTQLFKHNPVDLIGVSEHLEDLSSESLNVDVPAKPIDIDDLVIRSLELYEARKQIDSKRIDDNDPNMISIKPVFSSVSRASQFVCDVFVIMPFSDDFVAIYTDIIQPVSVSLNLSAKRGDYFRSNHQIMDEVWFALYNCRVVVADCTGNNPNVFYELGIAHTLGRPVIMIAQDVDKAPFDVRGRRFIKYENSLAGAKKLQTELETSIRNILNNMDEDTDD